VIADVLADVLSVLNGRDRRIFVAGAWPKTSRSELASEFGVSRVRQIEVRVFEKVQKAAKNRVAAIGTPVHQPMHELPGLSRWREKLPMDCR
jgi:DNA-directed RNA polymerase sigma subunit (sigma70/sigma32)